MATQTQSENKSVGIAKIVMLILTIGIIICLFTVPLWKSNVSHTAVISKVFGIASFIVAFGTIAVESWVRNRYSETAFFIAWIVSIIAGLLLMMNGGL